MPLAARGDRDVAVRPTAPNADRIEACRRGDRNALEEVLSAHTGAVERVLARIVGPRADVEDLLQETFFAAIQAFPRFRGEAPVKTWLCRIAINVAHNYLRQPRHRRDTAFDEERIEAATVDDPERRDVAARLYAHVDTLDVHKRIAFLLYVVGDMPISEIAALMGASKVATKSRIYWARRALRKRLARDPAFRGGST